MVSARGWERLGFARSSDYARERLGLSARSLQDLARVDALLEPLPLLEVALVSGALTWTKVRLLARVAKPDDEGRWIAFARGITSRQLAREVREIDLGAARVSLETDEDGAFEERRASLRVACTPDVQHRWYFVRQLARRVAGEPVPPWQALENVAAEVLSAVPLEVQPEELPPVSPAPKPASGCSAEGPGEERWPGGEKDASGELPSFLRSLVAGLDDADPFDLDARLRRAVGLEQRLDAELGEHLLQRTRRPSLAGAPRLDRHAREALGISPRKARGLLRVARVGRRIPALRDAWRAGRISWAQAQAIVPALLEEPARAEAWIERARRTTVRRLEEEAEAAGAEKARQAGAQASRSGESRHLQWTGPADAIALMRATLCTVRRRFGLGSDGEALGAMLDHAILAWGGNRPVRKAWSLFERDGWRCRVPGCTSHRELHDHHIVFRSAGGGDEPENRVTLCAFHHLRGVHGGRPSVRVGGRAPGGLRFELGLRRGGPPLACYRGETLAS
jgi:hypothetical protein